MVHVFTALGRKFALDADSGALHELDGIAYDAVSMLANGFSADETRRRLGGTSDIPDINELLGEIEALKREGQLFTSDDYTHFAPVTNGEAVLKAMCLHVAHDCDLRCRYCFAGTGGFHGTRGLMDADTGKKALDYLVSRSGERRFLEVDFFGGEPLLNFGVVKEIVAYGREIEKKTGKSIRFTLTTNGTHLSDEVIDYLNDEMENVVLSIDGRRDIHDHMRPDTDGNGSYEKIVPLYQKLIERRGGKSWYVRGTFTRKNLDFGRDVLHLRDLGFDQISVEPVVLSPSSPLSLRNEDLDCILNEYEQLALAISERRKQGSRFIFFHFMLDLGDGPCIKKRLSGCGAGNEYVAVTPEGDVYPCHQFVGREGYRMGSVHDNSFDKRMRADFAACHVFSKPECASCWAKLYCTGGCAANAHALNGDIRKPYALECAMEKKRLECAMALCAIERDNKPDVET